MATTKKSAGPTQVEAIVHSEKRSNIPTADAQDFVGDDVQAVQQLRWPRDPSLNSNNSHTVSECAFRPKIYTRRLRLGNPVRVGHGLIFAARVHIGHRQRGHEWPASFRSHRAVEAFKYRAVDILISCGLYSHYI